MPSAGLLISPNHSFPLEAANLEEWCNISTTSIRTDSANAQIQATLFATTVDFMKFLNPKWKLSQRVIPFVVAVIFAKLVAHYLDIEQFSLSPLFGAIISANVFLIGFLISGVLVDYKESEKLPGELACSFEVLVDECSIVHMNKGGPVTESLLAQIKILLASTLSWLHKEERTSELLTKVSALNLHFLALEPLTQANFIVRMKQEQSTIRRIVTRIHTIRETSFNPSAYAVAEIMSAILSIGLVLTRVEPYYESMFFISIVSFLQVYMVMLIREFDNPFDYYSNDALIENVSLKPLQDLQKRLSAISSP
jgi:hypothetical protein